MKKYTNRLFGIVGLLSMLITDSLGCFLGQGETPKFGQRISRLYRKETCGIGAKSFTDISGHQ
jgi:hypothetical protein